MWLGERTLLDEYFTWEIYVSLCPCNWEWQPFNTFCILSKCPLKSHLHTLNLSYFMHGTSTSMPFHFDSLNQSTYHKPHDTKCNLRCINESLDMMHNQWRTTPNWEQHKLNWTLWTINLSCTSNVDFRQRVKPFKWYAFISPIFWHVGQISTRFLTSTISN